MQEMTQQEWESLCDRCGRCCLHKLEDEDTQEVVYTRVSCQYMDSENCSCAVYDDRFAKVPECISLQRDIDDVLHWLPKTCAYRVLAEGRPLPPWHPLITGRTDSVHRAGISVIQFAVSEKVVHPDQLEELIVELPSLL